MSTVDVLDRSFQVYRNHFRPLVLTALIGFLPLTLLALPMSGPVGVQDPLTIMFAGILIVPVGAAVWNALTYMANSFAEGRTATVGEAYRHGIRRIFGTIGMALSVYLLLMLAIVPVAVLGGIVTAAGGPAAFASGLTIALGAVAIALGIVFVIWWASIALLALPTLIAEGSGPIASVTRSNRLAKGGRIRIALTGLLGWLITFLAALGVGVLLGITTVLLDPAAAAITTSGEAYLEAFLNLFIGAFTAPFSVLVMVMLYLDRRARREGYDIEAASAALATEF